MMYDETSVFNQYHQDGLGSVRQLTDLSGTQLIDYQYDVFGFARSTVGTSNNPFQFAGEQSDNETGLIYMRARYYDPVIGRFLESGSIIWEYLECH